jgi:flagellum-specific ATP synthase
MPSWLEADGPNVSIGTLCRIFNNANEVISLAEVVRVDGNGIAMAPLGNVQGLSLGARVEAVGEMAELPVGMTFLGRAIDALGKPIDGGAPILASDYYPLNPDPPSPLDRESGASLLETGIRAIDGFHPLSRGQRIGVFAASGVGKTSLLSQLVRQVDADICVCCLVGERGREVEATWSRDLSGTSRIRSVMIAATSDQAAALRVRAVHQAVALARYYRDAGLHVMLLIDSVTRYAMALREMGLAAGEPPTVRAYTPNIFSAIPRMVEQAGALQSGGSISAIMTILSETDDVDDPLSELMKSLLDGHIILSRSLAERGHFPAIDPLKSISRNANTIMTDRHLRSAHAAQALLECFDRSRTMIETGLYSAGSNADVDAAIRAQPELESVLRQGQAERSNLDATIDMIEAAVGTYVTA